MDNLKKFSGQSILKKAAINILVKNLEIEEIDMLDYEFNQIDTDGSGFIEASELKTTFYKYDEKLPSSKIDKII